tara:strand:- start:422 stop:1054 length:633 start_codon:yes stop_codon:yes gene_type:complete
MDYDEFAQPWQNQQKKNYRLPIKSNSRYFYKHYPNNWEIVYFQKGKKSLPLWLPKLSIHPLTPGVNGCEMRGRDVDDTLVKARLIEAGWTVISNDKHNYIQVYNGIDGKHYSDIFTKLVQLGNRVKPDHNQKSFNEFRLELMKGGDIPLPHPIILNGLLSECENSIERKINKQHIPEQKIKLEEKQRLREDMISAIQELEKRGRDVYSIG